jgi:hypothetical protein
MLQSFIKLIKIHMHHYIHITKIKTLAFFFHEFYGHECWDYLTIIHNFRITPPCWHQGQPNMQFSTLFFYSFMRLFCINEMKIIPPNHLATISSNVQCFLLEFHHFTTIPKFIFINSWFDTWNLQFFDIMETIKRCLKITLRIHQYKIDKNSS